MSSDCLRQLLKSRIIHQVIKDAQTKMRRRKYSLIVADDTTIKILNHVLKMHELNELEIGVVLNVNYNRQRVNVSPIYFLSPTKKSIEAMCDDYKDAEKPRYGAPIHVYFCSSLPGSLLDLMKTKPNFGPYLATLKEIPCNFLVLEQRVFSLNRDSAFDDLYLNKIQRNDEISETAKQLVALMLCINENPFIRFSKDSRNARELAKSFYTTFRHLRNNLHDFEPRHPRGTLLIMDRSDDPITPLLHQLTFQAMIMDLLNQNITPDGKINLNSAGSKEKDASKSQSLPDDTDEIWVQFRHDFIGHVLTELSDQFHAWQSANAAARYQTSRTGTTRATPPTTRLTRPKPSTTSSDTSNSSDASDSSQTRDSSSSGASGASGGACGAVDTRTLLEVARAMPQYTSLIKKYSGCINLAHALTRLYKAHDMENLISLEQDIVTGISEDGIKSDRTKIQEDLCKSLLLDPNKPQELKLRMFMMFIISQGGVTPDARKHLMTQSKFDKNAEQVLLNLGRLGIILQSDKPAQRGHKNKEYWKDMQKYAKGKCQNAENTLMRHMGYLEWVMNRHSKDELKEEEFEWIEKPDDSYSGRERQRSSLRDKVVTSYKRRRDAKKGQKTLKPVQSASKEKEEEVKPRLVVFVLGGVSYAEMCACYDFAEKSGVEVFVGSTSLLSPSKYLNLLGKEVKEA